MKLKKRMVFIILMASWACLSANWTYCETDDSMDVAMLAQAGNKQVPVSGETPGRLKIGFALQGGGAKGFAHIGVLRWLEENRIPVDMIAGTSMGGLIGGFYALGMSPDALETLVGTLDWNELIGGQIPFELLSIRRKEDRIAYPNQLTMGLRNGFQLPSGLNSGHGIGLILDRATLPYYDLPSFDALPIPFRCVAVNLTTGKQKVFSEGSLRDALRATMSIPGIFSPLRRDGQIYIDGGILNNLPVDLVKEFGTDAVIAINLDTGDYDPKAAGSLLGVVDRSVDAVIGDNVGRNLQLADLVVPVDIHGYSTLDFEFSAEIIRRGYDSAVAMSAELKKYALPEKEWNQYLDQRKSLRRTDLPVPQFVEVVDVHPDMASLIRRDLGYMIGHPLVLDELVLQLNRIWGQGRFASISYSLTNHDGRVGLQINPVEMEHSPPILDMGVNIDGSDIGMIRFGVSARLTFFGLWGPRSEWRTDAGFGTRNSAATEFYRPITGDSKWFIAPRAYAENSILDVYQSGSRIADYRVTRLGFGIQGGYQFNQATEVRLGQDLTWYEADLRIGTPQIEEYSHRVGVTSLQFRYLGQDDAVVPRKGIRLEAKGEWFSSQPYDGSGFPQAEMKLSFFQPVSQSGSLFLQGAGGTSFGREDLGLLSFSLGGIFRLGSYGRNELIGNQYYLATAGYLHEIAALPPLIGSEIYVASWGQLGRVYGNPDLPKYPMDISGGLIIKTMFGPVLLGGSYGSGGHRKLYVGIGTIF